MRKENELEKLLQQIDTECKAGNRKELTALLRCLLAARLPYYHESIEKQQEDRFSDSLFKILLLELDEEEEESIETAELAYIGISSVLNDKEAALPEHYKRRLLLLHYFSDFFTDAIIEIFLKKYRDENRLEARKLAIECLEKMQLADLFYLEENYPDYTDQDEQLGEACNTLEITPELSEEEQAQATLLHKILYAYLKVKYKN